MKEFDAELDKLLNDGVGNVYITLKTKYVSSKDIPNGPLSVKVDKKRNKRSLNANAYFWELCNKVADKLQTDSLCIYKKLISEQGIFKIIEINEQAADTFITSWGLHGKGWFCDKLDGSDNKGFVIIRAFYGSSVYNAKQMARLIDGVIYEAKELGIETITPAEKAFMIERWNEAK